jgi:hypothetical protein
MTTTAEAPSKTERQIADLADIADRSARARKAIGAANRKAAKLREDESQNRSTRGRAALLVKAEALDVVGLILAGKD